MVLRERDARIIQRIGFQAGIDVAGKCEERLPFRQIGKVAEPVGIELGETGRGMHQLRQSLLR